MRAASGSARRRSTAQALVSARDAVIEGAVGKASDSVVQSSVQ